MTLTVTPTVDQLYKTLGDFIESLISPVNAVVVPVIAIPSNRVAMPPPVPGFVGMRIGRHGRIMTNLDRWDPQAVAPVAIDIEQAMRLPIQLDCYGRLSHDWAVILETVLRDEYACTALAPILSPLYADDAKNAPLTDAEEEYENRWIIEAVMQYNPVVSVPMEFADTAQVTTINVDERYPP